MTKRRLTRIRLDKIAAVDQPCQEHATVAIIKRAPPEGAPPHTFKSGIAYRAILYTSSRG